MATSKREPRDTEIQNHLSTPSSVPRSLTGWATLNEGLSSVIPSWDFGLSYSTLPSRTWSREIKSSTTRHILKNVWMHARSTFYVLLTCTMCYGCTHMRLHAYLHCRIQVHIQISNIIYYILNSTSCKLGIMHYLLYTICTVYYLYMQIWLHLTCYILCIIYHILYGILCTIYGLSHNVYYLLCIILLNHVNKYIYVYVYIYIYILIFKIMYVVC